MSIKNKLLNIGRRKPREEEIRENIKIIHELIQEKLEEKLQEQKTEKEEQKENIENIKNQFYLEALAVANKEGEIIQKDGENFEELLKEKKLPKYITEQFPNTELFTIRNNGQNKLIYKEEDKLYLMKTPGTVSMPEIRRITQKLNKDD